MSGALAGMQVVNTRALHQAAELDSALIAAGATPLSFPCIQIVPPVETSAIDAAIKALMHGEFEWLIFTSANAVAALTGRLAGAVNANVAAIGPSTAGAIQRELGLTVSFVPEHHSAQGLAERIPIQSGDRVLLPASEIASPALEQLLTARGAAVTRVTAYRTITGWGGVDLRSLLASRQVDALTFASPSAVYGLFARFDSDGGSPWNEYGLPAACIGESTSETASKLGFTTVIAATRQSVEGLVIALESVLSTSLSGGITWR